ncbi:conserved hypothetical protein [Paraburkholderia ribeironis]|uniref:Uncharacterized protein n=1 Tax=Paraburkholderia ribeironis TaxID=1247936 RepID=A0A1N7RVQ6_9BURK|nr:hypothetical protein [Paraburkholderia ribeironis]SIT39174.1 conserved hypothetical protein [Paraburkholderia ribeironis]
MNFVAVPHKAAIIGLLPRYKHLIESTMNTASNVTTRATTAANATLFGKLRALALHALNLHLQQCAVIAEAHRRPQ